MQNTYIRTEDKLGTKTKDKDNNSKQAQRRRTTKREQRSCTKTDSERPTLHRAHSLATEGSAESEAQTSPDIYKTTRPTVNRERRMKLLGTVNRKKQQQNNNNTNNDDNEVRSSRNETSGFEIVLGPQALEWKSRISM